MILWKRLDKAGHDACCLLQQDTGWRLQGAAVFRHKSAPACLAYKVDCDGAWRTSEATVHGWVGDYPVDFRIERTPKGNWTLNDLAVPDLNGCVDLDFGFTPATNLFQLRRTALQVGQTANIPVAWLDVPDGTLDLLQQRYERRTAETYWYEAPRFAYTALLQVNTTGFVVNYPTLWAEDHS
jgi:hypothetical protein